jgi:putative FmdB family regulatory protein
MPVYDYDCQDCGPFSELRPMDESRSPAACPGCGSVVPRAYLAAPRLALLSAEVSHAYAVNERSAHEPTIGGGHRHSPTCGCSRGSNAAVARGGGSGIAKSFPNRRPWMISH